MLKKLLVPCLAIFSLAGCVSPSDNHLYLTPTMTQPQQDPAMNAISLTINAVDARSEVAVAKLEEDGQLVSLLASPDSRLILLDALDKQMRARGYMIDPSGDVRVTLTINELFANVQQGSFRYLITTTAKITVVAETPTGGNITKTFRAVTTREGALSAKRINVSNALDDTLSSLIKSMSDDITVHEFIKQHTR